MILSKYDNSVQSLVENVKPYLVPFRAFKFSILRLFLPPSLQIKGGMVYSCYLGPPTQAKSIKLGGEKVSTCTGSPLVRSRAYNCAVVVEPLLVDSSTVKNLSLIHI